MMLTRKEREQRRREYLARLESIRSLSKAIEDIAAGRGDHHIEMDSLGRGQLTLKCGDGKLLFFTVDPVLRPVPNRIGECKCADLFNHDKNCPIYPWVPF